MSANFSQKTEQKASTFSSCSRLKGRIWLSPFRDEPLSLISPRASGPAHFYGSPLKEGVLVCPQQNQMIPTKQHQCSPGEKSEKSKITSACSKARLQGFLTKPSCSKLYDTVSFTAFPECHLFLCALGCILVNDVWKCRSVPFTTTISRALHWCHWQKNLDNICLVHKVIKCKTEWTRCIGNRSFIHHLLDVKIFHWLKCFNIKKKNPHFRTRVL